MLYVKRDNFYVTKNKCSRLGLYNNAAHSRVENTITTPSLRGSLGQWKYLNLATVYWRSCTRFGLGLWFSRGTPVSSTNKTDRHDITEILLKVALSTIKPFKPTYFLFQHNKTYYSLRNMNFAFEFLSFHIHFQLDPRIIVLLLSSSVVNYISRLANI
jgi:hypothetical protein